MVKVIKEIELNYSDLVVQLLENDEMKILDRCEGECVIVCVHSELSNLMKALKELKD